LRRINMQNVSESPVNFEKQSLFKKIFLYHALVNETELKQIWVEDLAHFQTSEIEKAWFEWRTEATNEHKKPKSWDLVKLIKTARRQKIIPESKPDILKRGVSDTQDLLIEHLETMHKNMPDLMKTLKTCSSAPEKMLVCTAALEKPELLKTACVQMLMKKCEEYTRQEDLKLRQQEAFG
jgi:hypothetical protein